MKNLTKIYYLIWKLSVIPSAFVQSKGILKNHIRAAVGEKGSFLISHPNLPSWFHESSEMNAETKHSLITRSQKRNRKKSSVGALAFLICSWNGREWDGLKVCQHWKQVRHISQRCWGAFGSSAECPSPGSVPLVPGLWEGANPKCSQAVLTSAQRAGARCSAMAAIPTAATPGAVRASAHFPQPYLPY